MGPDNRCSCIKCRLLDPSPEHSIKNNLLPLSYILLGPNIGPKMIGLICIYICMYMHIHISVYVYIYVDILGSFHQTLGAQMAAKNMRI